MGTPRNAQINIKKLGNRKYLHVGMDKAIIQAVSTYYKSVVPDIIKLNINIDGIPLSKSSGSQFWPILAALADDLDVYTKPFVIGIYCGDTKPDDVNSFLEPFVKEYVHLRDNGVSIQNKQCYVRIHALICDAPARAFVCGIKHHTGYFGCSKCIVEGDFLDHKLVYLEVNCPLRTDM